jgi:hypothetical protein
MKLKQYLLLWSIIPLLSPSILFAEGPKDVDIMLPKPTKAIEAIKVSTGKSNKDLLNRSIGFSKRYPPNYTPLKDRLVTKIIDKVGDVGEPVNGRVSVNLVGDLIKTKDAKAKILKAGFEIVKVYHINKRRSLVSIVFTNDALKKMASKTNRGFSGTLRLLIDKKDKIYAITNPLYITKAFLQDDFDKKSSEKILDTITTEFKGLKNSFDKFKFQGLPKYQFMDGMPFYKDMVEVGNGNDLLAKLKNNKRVAFVLKLDKDSTLVGVKLSKRTKKFPKKIGLRNAGLLPYPVLIENGKAMALDPKYYISVMYPNLKMEEFMTIATVPEAIIKDCSRVFR